MRVPASYCSFQPNKVLALVREEAIEAAVPSSLRANPAQFILKLAEVPIDKVADGFRVDALTLFKSV